MTTKRKLYEVFKHPAPFDGRKWAVQFPTGIICFRTKKKAETVAAAGRYADPEAQK